MEKVDIYNSLHEKQNYSKYRNELSDGEYRLSSFIWIMNDKDEILLEQRSFKERIFPGRWACPAGGCDESETALEGAVRELKEELGISADKKDMIYIGSFIRLNDYVEVFVLHLNIDIKDLVIDEEEVIEAKWMSIKEFESVIESGNASETSFDVFKKYYDNFYNTYVVIESGVPIFKKKDKN